MAVINWAFLEHAPTWFHGMVIRNEDDSYTILTDPNDSFERRMIAAKHELDHINGGDFCIEDVQQIEADAHNKKMP